MTGESKIFVIKIGGSILCPDLVDSFNFPFAIEFRDKILHPYISRGYKFIITVGGGQLARKFQNRLKEFSVRENYQHRVGIISTLMNAVCFQSVIPELAHQRVIALDDYLQIFKFVNSKTFENSPVLLSCGGYKAESSTDMDAVLLAMRMGVNRVISLKNIDGIYTADPRVNQNARMVEAIDWDEYLNIINSANSHNPGDSWAIDPIAAREARDNNVEFVVIGKDLENLKKVLDGESFIGSTVK